MKAAVRSKYGPPEVLSIHEVNKPIPRDKEILVRVHAATVNRTDCGILFAKPFIIRFATGLFKPKLRSTGTDFAGIIEAIGKKVSNFRIGDRVWGFNDIGIGSHAQYIKIKEDGPVLKIPEGVSYPEAAASAEGAHYAYNAINKIKLQVGDNALVNGATGAIGSAAVQLLKYYGVTVTAVCNTRNIEMVRALGAHRIIDYEKEDFTKDKQKYEYVLDAVGKSIFGKCKPLLKPGGVYMSSELGPGAQNLYLPLLTRWSSKRLIFPFPVNLKRSLLLLNELLASGKFRPVIDKTYPFEKIREAFEYVLTGQKTGNVMLTME